MQMVPMVQEAERKQSVAMVQEAETKEPQQPPDFTPTTAIIHVDNGLSRMALRSVMLGVSFVLGSSSTDIELVLFPFAKHVSLSRFTHSSGLGVSLIVDEREPARQKALEEFTPLDVAF